MKKTLHPCCSGATSVKDFDRSVRVSFNASEQDPVELEDTNNRKTSYHMTIKESSAHWRCSQAMTRRIKKGVQEWI